MVDYDPRKNDNSCRRLCVFYPRNQKWVEYPASYQVRLKWWSPSCHLLIDFRSSVEEYEMTRHCTHPPHVRPTQIDYHTYLWTCLRPSQVGRWPRWRNRTFICPGSAGFVRKEVGRAARYGTPVDVSPRDDLAFQSSCDVVMLDSTGAATPIASMLAPRACDDDARGFFLLKCGDALYAVGGNHTSDAHMPMLSHRVTIECLRDPGGKWEYITQFPFPRAGFEARACGHYIFIFGGYDIRVPSSVIFDEEDGEVGEHRLNSYDSYDLFDTHSMTWVAVNGTVGVPQYNTPACSLVSPSEGGGPEVRPFICRTADETDDFFQTEKEVISYCQAQRKALEIY